VTGALSRDGRAAPPIRLVHLGLGNFFRAHQAWYTDHSRDAAGWGYAAFAGRSAGLAARLSAQDGLYTAITRAADGDRFDVIASLVAAHAADDQQAWLRYLRSPQLSVVTTTVTEAGYLRRADGGLDMKVQQLQADLEALRSDPDAVVRTAPARLVSGLAARRRADAGPLALVPCDNMAANGEAVTRVVGELAERLDPALAQWIADSVSVVTTEVDRITPRSTADDSSAVLSATGHRDDSPVVTEPFTEWTLCGAFPAGRPRWEDAGAVFTSDVTPFENRKLWMLNGAHSLLAYAGSMRGHETVAEAIADDACREWVEQWWAVAALHLTQPEAELDAYRRALLTRFANPRIRHLLVQIAADGSQKLPIRILPVLRAERSAGRIPPVATRILAAWICHLRGMGAPVSDVRAATVEAAAAGPIPPAVRRVLAELDAALAADEAVVAAVIDQVRELSAVARPPG
jgi:fructuronate reductase